MTAATMTAASRANALPILIAASVMMSLAMGIVLLWIGVVLLIVSLILNFVPIGGSRRRVF